MDGLDAIRELRSWENKHRPHFRQHVVGISAHASENDAEHGIVLGMNSYRNKPLKLQDLQNIANSDDVLAAGLLLDDMERKRRSAQHLKSSKTQETCLIATDESTEEEVAQIVQESGWLAVKVSSKNDFLDKLRSRTWDAVLLDGDLPDFATSIHEFREWESHNRVRRQRNLFLLSSGFSKAGSSTLSKVELPSGIDGVIGRPTSPHEVKKMLDIAAQARDALSFSASDIVSR